MMLWELAGGANRGYLLGGLCFWPDAECSALGTLCSVTPPLLLPLGHLFSGMSDWESNRLRPLELCGQVYEVEICRGKLRARRNTLHFSDQERYCPHPNLGSALPRALGTQEHPSFFLMLSGQH